MKRPELARILCYLQHVSQPRNYAGGLAKFAVDLIASSRQLIGTLRMRKAPPSDRYSLDDATAIFAQLTSNARYDIFGLNTKLFEEAFLRGEHERPQDQFSQSRRDWIPQFLDELTPARALAACTSAAEAELVHYLKEVCELPHIGLLPAARDHEHGAPWYFADIANALIAFIEERTKKQRSTLAETAITKLINPWMAKSRREQPPDNISP